MCKICQMLKQFGMYVSSLMVLVRRQICLTTFLIAQKFPSFILIFNLLQFTIIFKSLRIFFLMKVSCFWQHEAAWKINEFKNMIHIWQFKYKLQSIFSTWPLNLLPNLLRKLLISQMIAADRAMSILAPMANANTQRKRIKFMLVFTWIISFLFAVPAVSLLIAKLPPSNLRSNSMFLVFLTFNTTHFTRQKFCNHVWLFTLKTVFFLSTVYCTVRMSAKT